MHRHVQTAHSTCSDRLLANSNRLAAVEFLAAHVGGIDSRDTGNDRDCLGLWVGIWHQTKWQLRSGRTYHMAADARTTIAQRSAPWMHFNWSLTHFPFEVYWTNFVQGMPCIDRKSTRLN